MDCAYFWDMVILLISWVCLSLVICLALASSAAKPRPHAAERLETRREAMAETVTKAPASLMALPAAACEAMAETVTKAPTETNRPQAQAMLVEVS